MHDHTNSKFIPLHVMKVYRVRLDMSQLILHLDISLTLRGLGLGRNRCGCERSGN